MSSTQRSGAMAQPESQPTVPATAPANRPVRKGTVSWPSCSEHGVMYVVGPMIENVLYQAFQCCICGARTTLPLPPRPEPQSPYVVAVFPDGSWIEDGPRGRRRVSLDVGATDPAVVTNAGDISK